MESSTRVHIPGGLGWDCSMKPRTVRCPACSGPSVYAESNPSRPFCSERCRNRDFGAWASESYRVASAPDPDDVLDLDAPEAPDLPDPSGPKR